MSYTAFSVIFGEVPTTAKWNYLGANDASFNDGTGIADDAIIQRHIADAQVDTAQLTAAMQDYKELGTVELSGVGLELDIDPILPKKYLRIIVSLVATASGLDGWLRFNGDNSASYSEQYASNHGAQASGTGGSQLDCEVGNVVRDGAAFYVIDVYNPSGADKMVNIRSVFQTGITSATAPSWTTLQGMWNNTNQVTRVNFRTDVDMKAGASMTVLGHD